MAYDGAEKNTIREMLRAYGLSPNKQLGQNFLCDKNAADAIVRAAGDLSQNTVLEIGPGLGALTTRLLDGAKRVVAIEIDDGLFRALSQQLGERETLTLIHGDALKENLPALLGTVPQKVVGNLPYYITTPLILRCIKDLPGADTLVLMMQREVAQRLTAMGGKAYGSLSILVQYHMDVSEVMTLSPQCFYPAPTVESTVVKFIRRPYPIQAADADMLERVARAAFAMRRKTIYNNLITQFDRVRVQSALAAVGMEPRTRAEQVPPDGFVHLANAFSRLS
ncbi:16S rRNA (adenine(1518)-N(6)/adenine(1519)-N(6))-dimethyltransferase RsmA [Eubacteriales bacterium OttesenSCG-928-M02]|nr:16S rRNA (adenine(1518)-N(6)/adenine(1519)-N(6))-dimethyltransferase RsmA [Eubacteriales bacterium OttesenSCG-928-M02]